MHKTTGRKYPIGEAGRGKLEARRGKLEGKKLEGGSWKLEGRG